ncbi:MAG: hypothetical protein BWX71_02543 [Deltaproteobacteria bacterium ADurb.Bin072]|nr:MAG: hypothetical protein BWX71_02543 [Deltaproteobacteria bacterium ADurb.Bin072]
MVFATTARMITMITSDTMRMTMTMASDMEMNPMMKARSVSVSVSARELANMASISLATSAERLGSFTPIMKKPTWSAMEEYVLLTPSLR